MNEERFEDALKASFSEKYTIDETLRARTRRVLSEKQERRGNILLCIVQISMFVLSVVLAAAAYAVNHMILVFIVCHAMSGCLLTVIVILLYHKKILHEINVQ